MLQLMKCLITLWASLSFSMGSYGLNGNDITCDLKTENFDNGYCLGSISAISDMHMIITRIRNVKPLFCFPEEVTNEQTIKVINKYMEDNPQDLHQEFNALAIVAIKKAFPCEE